MKMAQVTELEFIWCLIVPGCLMVAACVLAVFAFVD